MYILIMVVSNVGFYSAYSASKTLLNNAKPAEVLLLHYIFFSMLNMQAGFISLFSLSPPFAL